MVNHCPLSKSIQLDIKISKFPLLDFMIVEIKFGLNPQARKKTSK